jgi:Uma2 family endonuclease
MEILPSYQTTEVHDDKHFATQPQSSKPKLVAKKNEKNPLSLLTQTGVVVFKSKMSREQFDFLVLSNEDIKIERDKFGTITIHPPITLNSGHDEGEAFFHLKYWTKKNPTLGYAYSPSTSFNMPDGTNYKADGAWINAEKVNKLSDKDRESIAHIVPDFVMEVRSKSDSITSLKKKMVEGWIANGVQLAWLIDPKKKMAWIYRNGASEPQEIIGFENTLYGEGALLGFEFDLREML